MGTEPGRTLACPASTQPTGVQSAMPLDTYRLGLAPPRGQNGYYKQIQFASSLNFGKDCVSLSSELSSELFSYQFLQKRPFNKIIYYFAFLNV